MWHFKIKKPYKIAVLAGIFLKNVKGVLLGGRRK